MRSQGSAHSGRVAKRRVFPGACREEGSISPSEAAEKLRRFGAPSNLAGFALFHEIPCRNTVIVPEPRVVGLGVT